MNELLKEFQPLVNMIIAIGTIAYVIITFYLLKSQQKLNEQNILPKLIIDYTLKNWDASGGGTSFRVLILNIGRGPAINLRILPLENGITIEETPNYLMPGSQFNMIVKYTFGYKGILYNENNEPNPIARLKIFYEDIAEKEYAVNYISKKYDKESAFKDELINNAFMMKQVFGETT